MDQEHGQGGWVKARTGLEDDPKLIAMAHHLAEQPAFREWLAPGWGSMPGPLPLRDGALRAVTAALQLRCWGVARAFGKYAGDDLVLPHIGLRGLDSWTGVDGFGKAMERVGWARQLGGESGGVVLPNFRQHNVPRTPAERQRAYRDRLKSGRNGAGTADPEPLPARYGPLRGRDNARDARVMPTVQYSTEGGLHPPSTPFTPAAAEPPAGAAAAGPALEPLNLLTYPCSGERKEWHLSRDQVAAWERLYPGLDVLAECRKALAWVESKPANRKTHGGMKTFLVNWLNRATDRGRPPAAGQRPDGQPETLDEKIKRAFERGKGSGNDVA